MGAFWLQKTGLNFEQQITKIGAQNQAKNGSKTYQKLDAEKAYFAAQKELIWGHFGSKKQDQFFGKKTHQIGAQKQAKMCSKT